MPGEFDLKEVLLSGQYISREDMEKAEKNARMRGISFLDSLRIDGLISDDLIGQAIAEHYKIPYADLNTNHPAQADVLKIPEEIARKFHCVYFTKDKSGIVVATSEPLQKGLLEELAKVFKNEKVKIAYALKEDIEVEFSHYRKPLETRFETILAKSKKVASELLDEIFGDAITNHASDIHFEPYADHAVVRFRVDGVMREAGRIPKDYYENILNRVKVLGKMRIDEHFSAQDGSIHYEMGNRGADMRVSIAPTITGEKIVLRVLAEYVKGLSMADLGMSTSDQEVFTRAINKPFGMIIITGPTGAGKTTTLYSFMRVLNTPDVNITTIEDPVEYKIKGLNQIQVNQATNLTFAQGLRSIVRQDPDIILVGEIRDTETVEISVNAALTGHLLFSTFHANDSATAIPRLLDMGAETFLLGSTLELVAGQRLVRRVCEYCRYSEEQSLEEIGKTLPQAEKYFSKGNTTFYKGKGCPACNFTGYRGRIAVFEFIEVTSEMRDLILQKPSAPKIWALARKQGSHSMFEDGIHKVKAGITTLDELLRVTNPPNEG